MSSIWGVFFEVNKISRVSCSAYNLKWCYKIVEIYFRNSSSVWETYRTLTTYQRWAHLCINGLPNKEFCPIWSINYPEELLKALLFPENFILCLLCFAYMPLIFELALPFVSFESKWLSNYLFPMSILIV